MNAHKAISARLSGFAGLTALVGTRIYPDILPSPSAWPAVTYTQISAQTEKGSTTDPAIARALIQVDCYDKTRMGVLLVSAQVRSALNRWRQTTSAGVTIDDCLFVGDTDSFESEPMVYRVSSDYRLHFRE